MVAKKYTYFIENTETGRIKVGTTDNHPTVRLRALQTSSDCRLNLIGFIESDPMRGTTERQVHRRLKRWKYPGGGEEWFTSEILPFVAELLRNFSLVGERLIP
jgi:hypothetical protein